MNAPTANLVLTALVLCIALTRSAMAAELSEAETLRGLDAVQLIVESLHEDAQRIGLTTASLREQIAQQLDEAGIRRLTGAERAEHARRPYLYINCNFLYVESIELASFSIDVEAHQRATLVTGDEAQVLTWAQSYQGIQSGQRAAEKIREVIASYVDEFIRAVHADDPSEPQGTPGP